MHAIITGGLGFIGSHTAEVLLAQGWRVTIVDDLSSNAVTPERFRGMAAFFHGPVCEVMSRLQPADVVIHLASIVGPLRVANYLGDIASEMTGDTEEVLAYCSRFGARLILGSSSDVYASSGWLDESAEVKPWTRETPRRSYALGKRMSEQLVLKARQTGRIAHTCVRFFNVAGPRQSGAGGFVLPRFVSAALAQDTLNVHGTGSQMRAFAHPCDIAEAISLLSKREDSPAVLNLGSPLNAIHITDLARLVTRLLGSRSPIEFIDPRQIYGPRFDDGFEKLPIIAQASSFLGWTPKRSLQLIIQDTAATTILGGACDASTND